TAVFDGHFSRVGSTNLNVASWFGNYELDVLVEDADFGRQMEEMFIRDMSNSTEIVLSETYKKRNRLPSESDFPARGAEVCGRQRPGRSMPRPRSVRPSRRKPRWAPRRQRCSSWRRSP